MRNYTFIFVCFQRFRCFRVTLRNYTFCFIEERLFATFQGKSTANYTCLGARIGNASKRHEKCNAYAEICTVQNFHQRSGEAQIFEYVLYPPFRSSEFSLPTISGQFIFLPTTSSTQVFFLCANDRLRLLRDVFSVVLSADDHVFLCALVALRHFFTLCFL